MKTRIIFTLTGLMLLSICFTSCRHDSELAPGTSTVCFNSDVMLIINTNCNISGCHGSGEDPALNTYDEVLRYVTPFKPVQSKLHEVITAHSNLMGLMPPEPNNALSSSQIDIISIWIMQGAVKDVNCVSSQ